MYHNIHHIFEQGPQCITEVCLCVRLLQLVFYTHSADQATNTTVTIRFAYRCVVSVAVQS